MISLNASTALLRTATVSWVVDRGLGGGDRVVVDVAQVAGGGLDGELVGAVLHALEPVDAVEHQVRRSRRSRRAGADGRALCGADLAGRRTA